ncbi:LuxR C-terminal-related transcriptional regulator [Microbacterium koreense]|uniref:LuxR C-terminal-related transcriptional regulator n=1 Tax=Microbacterium koreense TaxID=323761 RepID=A0ABW2ZMJ0_9MICO
MAGLSGGLNLSDPDRARRELALARATGDSEEIARAAMVNIWPLLTTHTQDLVSAVSALDMRVLERYPVLRIVHPMTAVLARSPRPFLPLVSSENARTKSEEEIDFVVLTQIIAYRTSGDITAALRYADRLADRIDNVTHASRDRLDGPRWYFHHQIAATYLAAGDTARTLRELATARQLARLSGQPGAERAVLGRVALAHATRGALGDADEVLAEICTQDPPTPAHASSSLSTESVAAALIAVDRMADDLDDRLRALPDYDSVELTWPLALLARTRAHLARHQPDDAVEAVRVARDAHPVRPGSLAHDVITAALIKSYLALDDVVRARTVADDARRAGVLTRLATVRLALGEGDTSTADRLLRMTADHIALGPLQRAEITVLSGWSELLRAGALDRQSALQISRVVERRDFRRLSTILPQPLVDAVRESLPDPRTAEFDVAVGTHLRADVAVRPSLTPSELRVLKALPRHASNAPLAAELHVSLNTVKTQLRSVYRKLGCATREEAVIQGQRLRLLD